MRDRRIDRFSTVPCRTSANRFADELFRILGKPRLAGRHLSALKEGLTARNTNYTALDGS